MKLINECISQDSSPRQVDLVMKCLWRIIKLMPNWAEEMDYDSILLEIHNFLKKFPSTWWKTKEIDTPLRTIKTILHSCVKIRGGSIMLHLGKIPNTGESEVESYILRILKVWFSFTCRLYFSMKRMGVFSEFENYGHPTSPPETGA